MPWKRIETAPKDGTILTVVAESKPKYSIFKSYPYPIKSGFYNGKWCHQFREKEWSPFEPQPTHYWVEP